MTELVPLTISAESLTAALEAVSSSGAPLLGATVQLQLHGTGFQSALTQRPDARRVGKASGSRWTPDP